VVVGKSSMSYNPYYEDEEDETFHRNSASDNRMLANAGASFGPLGSSTWEDEFRQLPPEGERLQQWRAEQPERIERKRREEESKREEIREAASKYISEFFEKRAQDVNRRKEENRAKDKDCYKDQFVDKEDEVEPAEAFDYVLGGKGPRLSARTESIYDTSSGRTRTQKELKRMRESMQSYKQHVVGE
jgi:vacuolar-type H+-ATPase subunit I/STV1